MEIKWRRIKRERERGGEKGREKEWEREERKIGERKRYLIYGHLCESEKPKK